MALILIILAIDDFYNQLNEMYYFEKRDNSPDEQETLIAWEGDEDHGHGHAQREEHPNQDQRDDPLLPPVIDAAHGDALLVESLISIQLLRCLFYSFHCTISFIDHTSLKLIPHSMIV